VEQKKGRKINSKARPTKPQEAIVDNHLVRALSHPLRARALAILNERVASPSEIAAELDFPVGNVSYHVNTLQELGCVELVKTAQRRGATEHYYRGVTRSFLNDANWSQLSPAAKNGVSVAGLKMINEAAMAAMLAETFDARPDRHLSCTPVALDEEGWGEVTALLAETLEQVIGIQTKSAARQVEADGKSVQATIALLSFESAPVEAEPGSED
jgi:DNA-binding transcriptional ArsR family regulator